MDIQVVSKTVKQVVCDALVVGAVRTKTAQMATTVVLSETAKSVDDLLGGLIKQICTDGEFKGNLGEITTIYTMGKLAAKRVIVVGLGAQETLKAEALRRAGAIAARHLQNTGAHHIALAQGSAKHPQFIILRYRGACQNTGKDMALVGKGIICETGGISLKPAERMHEMTGEMAGAAAVICAMQAIASLTPAINVTALV